MSCSSVAYIILSHDYKQDSAMYNLRKEGNPQKNTAAAVAIFPILVEGI